MVNLWLVGIQGLDFFFGGFILLVCVFDSHLVVPRLLVRKILYNISLTSPLSS